MRDSNRCIKTVEIDFGNVTCVTGGCHNDKNSPDHRR